MIEISYKRLTKAEWLKNMPELIKTLKADYNFYYNCFCCRINKDIAGIVESGSKKHKHKIVLYNNNKNYYLVLYKKNKIDIYYCIDYRLSKESAQRYFKAKFKKAYEKGTEIYDRKEIIKSY